MALWPWINKAEDDAIAATVPLVNDLSAVQYPTDNYHNYAEEGYGRNEIVHACIRELSTGVASARFIAQKETADGGVVEMFGTPLAKLLDRPNKDNDFYHWIERLVTYLYVSGNAYVLKERNKTNGIMALWLLRPDRVAIKPTDRGVNAYAYEIDGKTYEIPAEDVGHLSLPNPSGDVYGLSPLHVLAKVVNLDSSMTDFAKVYFQNSGIPSGLLKVKRRLNSQEDANRIRARWRSSFGGATNFHRLAVLDDDATYETIASAPKDMELEGLHWHTESRICAVLGVPPILISANVGLARSTFANYREARYSFHSETLEPLISRIVRFLNYCLSYEYGNGEQIVADLSQMREFLDDKDSISTRATAMFQGGLITLNEAREMIGMDAIDDGEVRRTPVNIVESDSFDSPEALPAIEAGNKALDAVKAPSVAAGAVRLRRDLIRDRDELTDKWEPQFKTYFRSIQNRMDGVLGRHMARETNEIKAEPFPFSWEDLLPDDRDLSNTLYRMYLDVSKQTFAHINNSSVAGVMEWAENLPAVSSVLTSTPARAKIIHSTSVKEVQKALDIAMSRGYSIEQLARGVPNEKFGGIRSMISEGMVRARLIARTEVMRSQNMTTTAFYSNQGYEWVRADDVDGGEGDNYVPAGDPYGRTCIERHTQIYHVSDAANIMDHPNGTLNWSPMPRDYNPNANVDYIDPALASFTQRFPDAVDPALRP